MKRLIAGALAGLALVAVLAAPRLAAAQDDQPRFPIPDLQIQIPGIANILTDAVPTSCPDNYSDVNSQGCLSFPWIGEYISSLYIFGVYAATIAASIVIMVGGFLWLTAGGNTAQIGSAKSYISGALLGLLLMLGSYTVLRLVNPNLVEFTALRIPVLQHISIRDYAIQLYSSGAAIGTCDGVTQLNNADGTAMPPGYQSYFNNAAAEFGLDPIFLAAVAQQESTFRPDAHNPSGAYGVMQVMPKTASDIWNNNPSIPRPSDCSGYNDPASGTYTDACKRAIANDPQMAIRMGAAYFKTINGRMSSCGFEGNTTLMAAGYNAGPYRRDICNGDVPKIDQTEIYVSKIKGYLKNLCALSGGTPKDPGTTPPGLETAPDLVGPQQPSQ